MEKQFQSGATRYSAFVSHAKEDGELALRLVKLLESKGLSCWIAPRDETPGRQYSEEIMRGLQSSGSMILLVSAYSNASRHVVREVEQALHQGKPIFPILFEKVRLSRSLDYYIKPIHWIELASASLEQHAATLESAINGDEDWEEHAIAPSIRRRFKYGSNTFWAAFAGAGIAIAVCLIGVVFVAQEWSSRRQADVDNSFMSLGFVTLSAERAPSAGQDAHSRPLNGRATVFLYGDTSFSDVKLRVSGVRAGASSSVDLSGRLDPRVVGSPQQVTFPVNGFGPKVVSCLSLPHPRLKTTYRVTQVFIPGDVASAPHSSSGEFARGAPESVRLEDGSECTVP